MYMYIYIYDTTYQPVQCSPLPTDAFRIPHIPPPPPPLSLHDLPPCKAIQTRPDQTASLVYLPNLASQHHPTKTQARVRLRVPFAFITSLRVHRIAWHGHGHDISQKRAKTRPQTNIADIDTISFVRSFVPHVSDSLRFVHVPMPSPSLVFRLSTCSSAPFASDAHFNLLVVVVAATAPPPPALSSPTLVLSRTNVPESHTPSPRRTRALSAAPPAPTST